MTTCRICPPAFQGYWVFSLKPKMEWLKFIFMMLFPSSSRWSLANTVLTVSVSTARTSKFSHLLRLADNFWWWVTIRGKHSYTGAGKCICDHVFFVSSAPHSASFLLFYFKLPHHSLGLLLGETPEEHEKNKTGLIYDVARLQCSKQLSGRHLKNICTGYMTWGRAMVGEIMCKWPYLDELLCCNGFFEGALKQ